MSHVVLASKSVFRLKMLVDAGVLAEAHPADIDERAVEAPAMARGASGAEVARLLSEAKALAVSHVKPDALVIGSDQTLALGERRFSKPRDRAEAVAHLKALRGRVHTLASGAALARGGVVLWSDVAEVKLAMRDFSDAFLESYLDRVGSVVTSTVGGYQLESLGVQLFERVDGDYFTVLGLPLLLLLGALRREGVLEA
jgi:septum formation protein